MSTAGAAELLADATQGGAYFVDARDRTALIEAAGTLGLVVVTIDCTLAAGRDAGLARMAQALQFPEWFGANWDALQDCLGDLSWLPGTGYLLVLDHTGGWREAEPDDFAILLDVLDAAAADWATRGVPFWALLPLPSAELADLEA